ncbi:MAG: glycosyltransferase family 4 protein [Ignavibacteria bacterium]|nr:glycosyltransferase family 4 protein [Ignavibacteria bacterium]
MSKPCILFVKHYSSNAGFILNDVDILKEKYDVDLYIAYTKKNILILASLLNQLLHHILKIGKYKLIYIWFGDYHSFIPVLLGKIFKIKSVIAVGGYDATNIPEIDCGAFNKSTLKKRIRSIMLEYSLRNADRILVVDDSLIKNENKYIYSDIPGKENLKDGILQYIPEIEKNIEVVYTGFDGNYFKKDGSISKEKIILSVGNSPNDNEFRRKGFDELIKAAGKMPEVKFVIVGLNPVQIDRLKKQNLNNLETYSFLNMDELRKMYARAKVFAQLSMFEGQPNSLCEAMMSECIPVGSDVNGIPRVIGDTGFIVYKKNTEEIILRLTEALNAPEDLGKKARQRILDNFSLERRKTSVLKISDELVKNQKFA